MARRVLGEQEWQREQGWVSEKEEQTCDEVVKELYDMGHPVASGKYKFQSCSYDL